MKRIVWIAVIVIGFACNNNTESTDTEDSERTETVDSTTAMPYPDTSTIKKHDMEGAVITFPEGTKNDTTVKQP